MENYKLIHQIGQGSFGIIHLAKKKDGRGDPFVVKQVKTSALTSREKADVSQEVLLLSKLRHPNIVAYIESFEDPMYVRIRLQE